MGQCDPAAAFNTFNPSSPFLQPGPGTTTTASKCAIPECPNPCHVDDDGTVHQCCSRSHARELEARSAQLQLLQTTTAAMIQPAGAAPMTIPAAAGVGISAPPPPPLPPQMSSALPPLQKCAIVECPNPRFVDETGTVHECCGITHAMEHQRRLALMQRKCENFLMSPECSK